MKNYHLLFIVLLAVILRIYYLINNAGDLSVANLGGDPCFHYNIAYNIAKGIGPKTSFIFSYWFSHDSVPALTDVYPPGFHFFSALFLLFNDHYLTGRFANFFISILTIVIIYFIGKKIHSNNLGLLASFMLSINYFHIENSTVFMTVNFYTFLVTLFFFLLFVLSEKKYTNLKQFLIGIVVGYSSISFGGWQVLLIIYLYYYFIIQHKFELKKKYLLFLIGFSLIFIPWAVETYNYFGIINYSNQKYYLYWSWGDMMNSNIKPNFHIFWDTLNLKEYIFDHIIWFKNNVIKFSLSLFPTFIFFLSFLLIPICLYGYYKLRDKNSIVFIIFIVIYFAAMSLASYSNGGVMYFRHFMPFLPVVSILLGAGILAIINLKIFKKLKNLKNYFIFSIYLLSIIGTLIGFEIKETFWQRDSKPFYNFSKIIKKNVPNNQRIMYGLTVSDAWCSTGREIIQDPSFLQTKSPERAIEEIKKYDVSYLFIDLSDQIYDRSLHTLEETLSFYEGINLKKIASDEINGFYLFKIGEYE